MFSLVHMFQKKKTKAMSLKIAVGVSGGVDSSVVLGLLQKQGRDVYGCFIKTWQPDFIACTWRTERRDAMRVCAHFDVPFLECDAVETYKRDVADYMIAEYKAGRTPNPDVFCNRYVKFGAMWDLLKEHGIETLATGHYAQSIQNKEGTHELHKGADASKDQSYFLWTLTSEELSKIQFPLGSLKKSEVRKLAEKMHLSTAKKKDSQGVCLLGDLDMKDFLSHYIEPKVGEVRSLDGEVVGEHDGVWFYTLGSRHGFTITKKTQNDTPYFVIEKDIQNNVLVVSQNPEEISLQNTDTSKKKTVLHSVIIRETRDFLRESVFECEVQTRYHGELYPVKITKTGVDTCEVFWNREVPLVASGQSVVFYTDSLCIGGGIFS